MDVGGEGCGGEEEVGRRAEEVGGGARWHRRRPGVCEGGVCEGGVEEGGVEEGGVEEEKEKQTKRKRK